MRLGLRCIIVVSAFSLPASAQLPELGSVLKGGGLPNIGSAGVGNAAGLLTYCLKNQLLGGAGAGDASSALSALAGKPGVAGSPGFAAGQAGTVVTGQGQKLAIGNLGDKLKSQLCAMVLQRAKSLL